MKNTTALTLVALLVAAAGAHAQQTFTPVTQVIVVDANGKKVGSVVASFYDVSTATPINTVALELSGHVVRVNLTRTDFSTSSMAQISWESTDCSGTPYVSVQNAQDVNLGDDLFPATIVQPPGRTVYLVDPTAAPTTRVFNSYVYLNVPQNQLGCVHRPTPSDPIPAIPALALGDLLSAFTPPFHVEGTPLSECGAGSCDANGDGMVTIDELLKGVNEALNGCTAAPAPSCCQGSGTCGPPVAGACPTGSTPMSGSVCNGATGTCEAR